MCCCLRWRLTPSPTCGAPPYMRLPRCGPAVSQSAVVPRLACSLLHARASCMRGLGIFRKTTALHRNICSYTLTTALALPMNDSAMVSGLIGADVADYVHSAEDSMTSLTQGREQCTHREALVHGALSGCLGCNVTVSQGTAQSAAIMLQTWKERTVNKYGRTIIA